MKRSSLPPIFIILPILLAVIVVALITISNSKPNVQNVEVVIPNDRFKN